MLLRQTFISSVFSVNEVTKNIIEFVCTENTPHLRQDPMEPIQVVVSVFELERKCKFPTAADGVAVLVNIISDWFAERREIGFRGVHSDQGSFMAVK